MTDPTQTLSVELTREEADVLSWPDNGQVLAIAWQRDAAESGKAKLRAALTQPEHQGEEAHRAVAHIVSRWLLTRGAEIRSGEPLTGTPDSIAQEILAALPPQPPTPALSDEERERLEEIAQHFELWAKNTTGHLSDHHRQQAAFLRTLASQEQGEEECEACGRPGVGMRDMHGERFVLCPRCARDHGGPPEHLEQPEVPEEAVEDMAQVRLGPNWKGLVRGKDTPARRLAVQGKKAEEEEVLAEIRAELQAAAPSIRKQERERAEGLAMKVLQYLDGLHVNESVARKELRQAALDSLGDSR